jgi:hypothetical protein
MRRFTASTLLVLGLATPSPPTARAERFDGERAMEYLTQQVEFGPRAPGSAAHDQCLDWLLEQFGKRADRVRAHRFEIQDPYGPGTLGLANVHAAFRPELSDRIALGAHWDSRPRADRQAGGSLEEPIPGANDGASGVAVLLALADRLAEDPPSMGVDLLLFDAEDYGREGDLDHYLIGSRRFVADHPDYRPRAFILVDMVGDKDLRIPLELYGRRAAPELTKLVFERAMAMGLPAFDPVPGAAVYDDHVPFLERGIPAVNLIDFEYPYWHTLEDLPERCSADSLEQVGSLLLALLRVDLAP